MVIDRNISLRPYNTFGFDVNAQIFAEIKDIEDIRGIYKNPEFNPLPKIILGGGSNVLFTENQRKVVLKMAIDGIEVLKEDAHHVWVKVGAGEIWHQFVLWCIENNLGGTENLSLIPGTVGAAPMQNIGAYGVELKEVFESLEAYEISSGKTRTFTEKDCQFGYRYSVFKGNSKDQFIITSVTFKLAKQPRFNTEYAGIRQQLDQMGCDELSVKAISEAVIQIRMKKLPDPSVIGNAGSFFKNPVVERPFFDALEAAFPGIPQFPVSEDWVKVPAAWLIDQCGWKGKRRGDVGVHEKQALVLVNYGGGSGKEVFRLSEMIRESVQKKFGVELHREVNVI